MIESSSFSLDNLLGSPAGQARSAGLLCAKKTLRRERFGAPFACPNGEHAVPSHSTLCHLLQAVKRSRTDFAQGRSRAVFAHCKERGITMREFALAFLQGPITTVHNGRDPLVKRREASKP